MCNSFIIHRCVECGRIIKTARVEVIDGIESEIAVTDEEIAVSVAGQTARATAAAAACAACAAGSTFNAVTVGSGEVFVGPAEGFAAVSAGLSILSGSSLATSSTDCGNDGTCL